MPHTVVQTPVVSTSMQRPVPGPPNAALLKTCTDLASGRGRNIKICHEKEKKGRIYYKKYRWGSMRREDVWPIGTKGPYIPPKYFPWGINIRNTEEAVWGPQYSPRLSYWPRPIGQSVYYGPSTASEVFLNFTTQLYACLCNDNVIVFISWQEGSIATGILPSHNTPLSSLPVDSKNQ